MTVETDPPTLTAREGHIEGAAKDGRSITAEWRPLIDPIAGVAVREVLQVPKRNGYLTEIYRADWGLDALGVDQIFQSVIFPGGVSAWHAHRTTTDKLFVTLGLVEIALYDAREESPTKGRLNVLRHGSVRPALVVIPPGVWHGVHNIGHEVACLLNIVDRAYEYEDPDHWRLPAGTDKIPYRFPRA